MRGQYDPRNLDRALARIAEGRAAESPTVTLFEVEARALADEIDRLRVFEAAMRSMAAQFLCPKTTAEEMAAQILGGEK